MKKKGVGLLILIAGVLLVVYFFIPDSKTGSVKHLVTCNNDAAMRVILNESKWQNWWPGEKTTDSAYTSNGVHYKISKILLNGFNLSAYNNTDTVKINFQVEPVGLDSSYFSWTFSQQMPVSPLKKINSYFNANKVISNIETLALEFKKHFDKEENVYGMKVQMDKVKDSTMISMKSTFNHYPSTGEIYAMINAVKEYIKVKKGEETDYPMLNIHSESPGSFETMVAVPTKAPIPSEGKFLVKRMILGNILAGEIKGGVTTIMEGEKNLAFYVTDHHKLSPAIPYQSLISNRLLEPDSTKWITRLYFPVFY